MEGYHKYVFDLDKREFVGDFETMYKNEEAEGYDSWHQSNINFLKNKFAVAIINQYNFKSIIDFGCGKGHFTNQLKKNNNSVLGIDISETAVAKAKQRYPDIDFESMDADSFLNRTQGCELLVCMETLSYLENWKNFLEKVSTTTQYLYVSLFIPENPIGFVKSIDGLQDELKNHFETKDFVELHRNTVLYLGKSKNFK
ncbi:MAG: hypothetical protein CL840_13055 [Crocinitomicaceae bacterium]|nr:hypothetical protein [Crocinitomicaceae bacterium]|tara:strand:- start:27031 stop:27627 length:597 start_codon:yes stop_codon:yes gene_type:complete